jgi:hypothetical protein
LVDSWIIMAHNECVVAIVLKLVKDAFIKCTNKSCFQIILQNKNRKIKALSETEMLWYKQG